MEKDNVKDKEKLQNYFDSVNENDEQRKTVSEKREEIRKLVRSHTIRANAAEYTSSEDGNQARQTENWFRLSQEPFPEFNAYTFWDLLHVLWILPILIIFPLIFLLMFMNVDSAAYGKGCVNVTRALFELLKDSTFVIPSGIAHFHLISLERDNIVAENGVYSIPLLLVIYVMNSSLHFVVCQFTMKKELEYLAVFAPFIFSAINSLLVYFQFYDRPYTNGIGYLIIVQLVVIYLPYVLYLEGLLDNDAILNILVFSPIFIEICASCAKYCAYVAHREHGDLRGLVAVMGTTFSRLEAWRFVAFHILWIADHNDNLGRVLLNMFLGIIIETSSQGGVFECLIDYVYEVIYGHEFQEPEDTVNSYRDIDGICRACAHFCEYIPCSVYCALYIVYFNGLTADEIHPDSQTVYGDISLVWMFVIYYCGEFFAEYLIITIKISDFTGYRRVNIFTEVPLYIWLLILLDGSFISRAFEWFQVVYIPLK